MAASTHVAPANARPASTDFFAAKLPDLRNDGIAYINLDSYWDNLSSAQRISFVKRAHDGRRRVALAFNGESRFHTTSVANLAELIRLAAAQPGDRALNCGDPDPPTTLEICKAVGNALEHEFEPVLLPDDAVDNPWGAPASRPFVVSMEAAERELGYRPVTTYPEAVRETCEWLVGELEQGRSTSGDADTARPYTRRPWS